VNALHDTLGRFAGRVNDTAALRSTLAGWQPQFFIQARDSEQTFQVQLHEGRVAGVLATSTEPGDNALLLRGDSAVLQQVFEGGLSPLGAYTDGALEVYGPTKDQIKLDVIALVLWGA
jgi:SCP-2 sterol transfer family